MRRTPPWLGCAGAAAAVLLAAGCGGRHAAARGPVPRGFDPVSVTAVSPQDLWVLGQARCGASLCTAVVRTTDGGRHWAGVPAPPAPVADTLEAPGTVDTLRFATPLVGYAFNRQVLRSNHRETPLWQTTDGGGHWRRLALSNVRAFATSGGDVDVVTAACGTGPCTHLSFRRAPLGTTAWHTTVLPVTTSESLVALAVHGASVWISVSPATRTPHPHETLLTSRDGGASFTARQSPCWNGLDGELEATSSSVVWAVCPTGMMASAVRSGDGGATWRTLDVGPLSNAARLVPASDTTALLETGDQTQLLRTTDGGRTFAQAHAPAPGSWGEVGFVDTRTGDAIRVLPGRARTSLGPPYGELLHTADGGAAWTPVPIR